MNTPFLVLDTSAPTATIALGPAGRRGLERALPQKQTSEQLLAMVDDLVRAAGTTVARLAGLVAVRGPGSFTGLRIGLATAYGLHQATGVRAATVTTLEALGRVHPTAGASAAVVDALRGEWFVQTFRDGLAGDPVPTPRILSTEALGALEVEGWIGYGDPAKPPDGATARWSTPGNLAGELLTALEPSSLDWDPSTLLEPLYLRGPAVTLPAKKSTEKIG